MSRVSLVLAFGSIVVACSDDPADPPADTSAQDGGTARPTDRRDAGAATVDASTEAASPRGPTCLPDGTVLQVSALGDSSYFIDGAADPTLTLCRGRSYTFRVGALHHPFYVKTSRSSGRVDTYGSGVTNNGTDSGDVVLVVPADAPALLHYVCSAHPEMVGDLVIVDGL